MGFDRGTGAHCFSSYLYFGRLFLSVYYSIPYDEWVELENKRAKDELDRKAKKEKRGKKHGR